jgi:hypothetical protein
VQPRDYLIALALLLATFGALGLAQRSQGVMRDEGTYFDAARQYWGWFDTLVESWRGETTTRPLRAGTITRHWKVNREHPVLLKSLFAVSWHLLHRSEAALEQAPGSRAPPPKSSLDAISAFRLPGWLFTAFGVALIYLFGVRIEGRTAGLAAALLYITIPRVFFHGQLACFDSPIATCWLLVVYCYYRSLCSARWGLIAGIAFGIALATKHNAWFIPPLLIIHYLVVVWPDLSLRPLALPRIPLALVAMALLGPLIFYAHWPWLWFDTVEHLRWYFQFHLRHAFYNMEFLGVNYGPPPLPIAYPFAMTLFTVSTVTLVLALAAFWIYGRRPLIALSSRWIGLRPPGRFDDPFRYPARRSWTRPAEGLNPRIGLLLLLNAGFPLLLIALPWTPIFGGTKHWLPAYPFIVLAAGVSLGRLAAAMRARGRWSRVLAPALPLLVALPGAINTAQTHPFGLSQYNALAGGVPGAADLGLNRQFWGYAPRQVLPWLNDEVADNTPVYYHDVSHGAYRAYRRAGLLRRDLPWAGVEQVGIRRSRVALVVHELHFNRYDYWIWSAYGSPVPARVLTLDGVPLVSIYARPGSLLAGSSPAVDQVKLDAAREVGVYAAGGEFLSAERGDHD